MSLPASLITPLSPLLLVASFALVGCDSNRRPLETAPAAEAATTRAGVDGGPQDNDPDAARGTRLGGPLAGLDGADLARFAAGLDEFEEAETAEDGLGPVFNDVSCAACHSGPVGGTNGRLETRFGRWSGDQFDPLEHLGGSLMQDHGIGRVDTEHGSYTFLPEVVPPEASVKALRLTTPLFGLGLVDAVSDEALLELARTQARETPSTRGAPHMVKDVHSGAIRVGRFGWKAQVATLHTFSGDAYLNEMGITSPDFPEENYPQGDKTLMAYNPRPEMNDEGDGIEAFTAFMTLLGPPPSGLRSSHTETGRKVFAEIGCANCHVATLTTGDSPVPAIARKRFQPYSDFLLHDMGSLGDGIAQGQASGRDMRTAPLWGLSARPAYLHDGRAKSVEAAIREHAGQGTDSRNRFLRLGAIERQALLSFLKSI